MDQIQYLIPIGMILIFLGIAAIFAGTIMQTQKTDGNKSVHISIGGLIGPIPFGFVNSRTAIYITLGAAAFFLIVWLVLRTQS